MRSLISEFERFQTDRPRANPPHLSETTAFIQHLSAEGTLGEFTDADWLRLAQKLDLTDDQYAAMFEGTASWITAEPPIEDQEPADWPDETPGGVRLLANPGHAVRGTEEFDKLIEELNDEWEFSSADLRRIEAIKRVGKNFEIKLRGSGEWKKVVED